MVASALLLDLDGTVWDSRPWYAATIAQLSGGSVSKIASELNAGSSIVKLVGSYGVGKTKFTRAVTEDAASLKLYDGVVETLDALKERGNSIGIVSNLPGWLVRPLLEAKRLDSYFDIVVTPRRGVPAKPNPHGISKALRELEQAADAQVWLIGDEETDAGAAMAAGVNFAWASYGYGPEQLPGTAKVLECFLEVLEL